MAAGAGRADGRAGGWCGRWRRWGYQRGDFGFGEKMRELRHRTSGTGDEAAQPGEAAWQDVDARGADAVVGADAGAEWARPRTAQGDDQTVGEAAGAGLDQDDERVGDPEFVRLLGHGAAERVHDRGESLGRGKIGDEWSGRHGPWI